MRAAIATGMLYWCIKTHDWGIASVSLVLLAMAITNTGCCGSRACYVSNETTLKDIGQRRDFEEIN